MSYTRVTVKETRDRLAELIERVAVGKESFMITKFNKPKAIIAPIDLATKYQADPREGLKALAGIWEKRSEMESSAKWVASLRRRQSRRRK